MDSTLVASPTSWLVSPLDSLRAGGQGGGEAGAAGVGGARQMEGGHRACVRVGPEWRGERHRWAGCERPSPGRLAGPTPGCSSSCTLACQT